MERKLATVLFADLVGSTELGEQDPERTRATLERFYDAMEAEVALAGGTLEKFAGDAVMAAFGAPAALEDHAERALHAALAMQRRMREIFGGDLELRVGVNTGDVVVGRPREGSSFVTGDAVNVAARLEQAAAPGEILAGERTIAAAQGAFEFAEATVVAARGKPAGVAGARLVRALSLMRPRGVRGLGRVFVGRDTELALLQASYLRSAERGEPHIVTIMGESGVGKTTLVRELWEWLGEQDPPPLRRTGRCLAYGHGITYWPLGEILKEHLGVVETDAPEEVRRRLGAREILGLTLGLDVAGDTHPLAARDRLHAGWSAFLEELAEQSPVVVLVEDLHWAEEPLLELLERVVRDVRGPLFVIATTRPELLVRRPTWGGGTRNAALVALEPLAEADTRRLVDELLAGDLPEPLRAAIVGHAEGNPFFVEEVIATLIDRGAVERRDGRWHAREVESGFAVPDTVHAVLAARIDLLPPREKAALQAAAVVGRVFWDEPVRVLVGEEPDLSLLEERDFVRRRSGSSMPGRREYVIKHALTREVAYASLPKARRARLHAAFADWLAQLGSPRDDLAPLAAHHYAEAVRPEDADLAWHGDEAELARLRAAAARSLAHAGALARRRGAFDDAVAVLDRAVELEDDVGRRSQVLRELGIAHALRYDGESFWSVMQRSLEICPDRATCADTYSQLAFQTAIRSGMWPATPAVEVVDDWIERALELAAPGSTAQTRALIARAAWTRQRADDAAAAAEAAAEAADRHGGADLRSWSWMARAAAAFGEHHFDDALAWALRRLELEPEIDDPDHLTEMRETAIPLLAMIGRLDEARRFVDEHLERSRSLSAHHRLHSVALHVEVEETAGEWGALAGLHDTVCAAVEANSQTPCVRNQRSLLLCAAALAYTGAADRAAELERRAEAVPAEPVILVPARARLALARGDLDRVAALLDGDVPLLATFGAGALATRLDGLAALGDRDRLEQEAPQWLRPGLVTEPYAQRALAIVRADEQLLDAARAGFARLGMGHQAAATAALL